MQIKKLNYRQTRTRGQIRKLESQVQIWKLKREYGNLRETRKLKCKSGNFRAIQETEVQIWKLEGNSGNSSANQETQVQIRNSRSNPGT